MTLPKDGSPTIRVQLSARYIQTDTLATAGRADGNVVFTINYYYSMLFGWHTQQKCNSMTINIPLLSLTSLCGI